MYARMYALGDVTSSPMLRGQARARRRPALHRNELGGCGGAAASRSHQGLVAPCEKHPAKHPALIATGEVEPVPAVAPLEEHKELTHLECMCHA